MNNREGYVLLLDSGRMTLKTELQAVDTQLEDATLMELEELLFDRLHMVFSDGQVLLCHTGKQIFYSSSNCEKNFNY